MEHTMEDRFRDGLNAYIKARKIRPTAIADDAGIKRDRFSRIRKSGKRIFGNEMAAIAHGEHMTIEEMANFHDTKGA
jgi:hypothetical protein